MDWVGGQEITFVKLPELWDDSQKLEHSINKAEISVSPLGRIGQQEPNHSSILHFELLFKLNSSAKLLLLSQILESR